MAKYYYDKYKVKKEHIITQVKSFSESVGTSETFNEITETTDSDFYSSRTLTLSGLTVGKKVLGNLNGLLTIKTSSSKYMYEILRKSGIVWSTNIEGNVFKHDGFYYEKTTLNETRIKAEEGTYPDNGLHTDGFWYVKGDKATIPINTNIRGVWEESEAGYINVNGVWKEIKEIHQMQNGAWSKLF